MRPARTACEIAAFPGWLDDPTCLEGEVARACSAEASQKTGDTGGRARWSRAREQPRSGPAAMAEPGAEAESIPEAHSPACNLVAEVPAAVSKQAVPACGRARWRKDRTATRAQAQAQADCSMPPAASELLASCAVSESDAPTGIELQPGLVWLQGAISEAAQQWVVEEALRIGGVEADNRLGRARSGGFYRATSSGGWELNQADERRGSFVKRFQELHSALQDLCSQAFARAHAVSAALPPLDAQACIFNFYADDSPGLRWHRDIDETKERCEQGLGRPVVSLSFGDDCDFEYRREHMTDQAHRVRLRSGDVLVFGGPSRGVLHAVTRVHPQTRPPWLRMHPGRLNLTCRHHA